MAIQLMACRDLFLRYCWQGFLKTGYGLVAFDGSVYLPFPARFDDLGMYIGVPLLGHIFGISYEESLRLFFAILIGFAWVIGLGGVWQLSSSWFPRITGVITLTAATWLSLFVSDVYMAYGMAVLPLLWFLGAIRTARLPYGIAFAIGIYWGALHYVRAYSSFAPFVVALFLIWCMTFSFTKKSILQLVLITGFIVPGFYVRHVLNQYKRFAHEHFVGHEQEVAGHTLWHPVYLGFGLLSYGNKDGIVWDDAYGYKKYCVAEQYDNTLQSNAYEKMIGADVKKLILEQPRFVLWTIWAKIGILLWYLLLAVNIALGALCALCRKERLVSLILILGIALSALFPLISLPLLNYSLGFIAMVSIVAYYALVRYQAVYGLTWWLALYPFSIIGLRCIVRFL